MYDDHLDVESPGVLPGIVKVNNIREFHFSRNPKIVELLTEYDLVKEFGEGVDRVYRDMEAAGLPDPVYRQTDFMLYATLKNKNWGTDASWVVTTHDTTHDKTHDGTQETTQEDKLIAFCDRERTRQEMMDFLGLVNRKHFGEKYMKPLLQSGQLRMMLPNKPQSKNQKYIATKNEAEREQAIIDNNKKVPGKLKR